eukprot:45551-Eustigmatos_ZCMA.PRE.1
MRRAQNKETDRHSTAQLSLSCLARTHRLPFRKGCHSSLSSSFRVIYAAALSSLCPALEPSFVAGRA